MTRRSLGVVVTALLLTTGAINGDVKAQYKVCPDPSHPCGDFERNELAFKITRKFHFDRREDRSAPFCNHLEKR